MKKAKELQKVVVLGGGFAGIMAARRIARRARGRARVLLVAAGDAFVERVRFHELAARGAIPRVPLAPFLEKAGVAVLQATATAIDPAARRVSCRRPDGGAEEVAYDQLVYALGSTIDLGAVPGAAEHAASVADERSARALAETLRGLPDGARVVICGGGMTGVELASEIAEVYPRLSIRIVTRDAPAEPLVARARDHLMGWLGRHRIEVQTGAVAREVRPGELVLEDGGVVPFDVCVWAASFTVSPLARASGLAVHARGQLEVDELLRSTSHPEIWGAGDAALPTCTVPIRMGCATAMPMAAQVAYNVLAVLLGRKPLPFRFAYLARFISLGRRDAVAQFVRRDDSPRRLTFTGRLAAWMKEQTFRLNLFVLRTGIFPFRAYRWLM